MLLGERQILGLYELIYKHPFEYAIVCDSHQGKLLRIDRELFHEKVF
jgi:hypothetical protein